MSLAFDPASLAAESFSHPHDATCPLRSAFPRTTLAFPQSHWQFHMAPSDLKPMLDARPAYETATSFPKRWPVMSLYLMVFFRDRNIFSLTETGYFVC